MRKLSIIILSLTYAFFQLINFSWNLYKPVLHAICYNQLRIRNHNRSENEFVIKTDPSSYQNALRDKHEILWEGELYDINSITVNGNEITLVVNKDIIETRWVDVYNDIQHRIDNNRSQQSPTDMRFCVWMFILYMPSAHDVSTISTSLFTPQNSLYLSAFNSVFYPDGLCQPPDSIS